VPSWHWEVRLPERFGIAVWPKILFTRPLAQSSINMKQHKPTGRATPGLGKFEILRIAEEKRQVVHRDLPFERFFLFLFRRVLLVRTVLNLIAGIHFRLVVAFQFQLLLRIRTD